MKTIKIKPDLRTIYLIVSIALFFTVACTKSGNKPPAQIQPVDTTTTTPPKDTTTVPPKDTATMPPTDTTVVTPPTDTTTAPTLTYKAIITNRSVINETGTNKYDMDYFNDNGNDMQVNSYGTPEGVLSSHNCNAPTVTTDANTGDQLLTPSNLLNKSSSEAVSISDTAGHYYLLLVQGNTATIVLPVKPLHYRNFSTLVTADDEKTINNRDVFIVNLVTQ